MGLSLSVALSIMRPSNRPAEDRPGPLAGGLPAEPCLLLIPKPASTARSNCPPWTVRDHTAAFAVGWEHLKLLALCSIRDCFEAGRNGSQIAASAT